MRTFIYFSSFKSNIDKFGVFEGSRTLFLNMYKSETIASIHQDIQTLRDDHLKGKLKSFFISDTPHMTISKTTGKKMLYESLQHFQKNGHSEQIQVNHLTLVSRSKYKTWDWEHEIKLA
ncbi:2'-5' RNA ligase family protein [Spongiimicrobium sp. 2-473A-2-J]|uniref:2'-5' RNA ligase family protein n=1 Tax=Eudoraea algarum TaxID=3417568 RepID=UPI003D36746A